MSKAQWRTRMRARLRAMTVHERQVAALRAVRALRRRPAYRKARWILCYLAAKGEVETRPLIAQALADGKRVAAPITLTTRRMIRLAELTTVTRGLVRGPYGIQQPDPRRARRVDPRRIDLAVIPGLAFDADGYRLGRGGGYFDRFLAALPPTVPRIGLAYRCQRVRRLLRAPHDQPVTTVLAV